MSPGPRWISFGTVARAHGVRGELRVVPLALDEPFPEKAAMVRVRSVSLERVLTVRSVRPIHRAILMAFEEIPDRDAARELTGASVEVDANVLPGPSAGEVYIYELEGATVQDESGTVFGVVKRVVDNHGQDLLEIQSEEGERLLPFVEQTIVRFDRDTNALVIRPIAGLWE
ncbi:ribosome maturation factor RimM [Myxococcota bacterium]